MRALLVACAATLGGLPLVQASEVTTTVLETLSYEAIASVNGLGDPENVVLNDNLTGGYMANGIRLRGALTEVRPNTFASEADLQLSTGSGSFFLNGSTTNGYNGSINTETLLNTDPFDPAGAVSIEFFESFDDGPGTDQTWDAVEIAFVRNEITNGVFDVGALTPDGRPVLRSGSNVAGGLDFYTFEIGAGVGSGYLNLQTRDPFSGDPIDTDVALYDGAGNFVAADDDGQASGLGGLYSMLSFGNDPLAPGGSDANSGEDGATLPGGTYTLVVGGFDTRFGATLNDITPGTSSGDYDLQLTYVPEPSSLLLLLATCATLRRRR